MHSHDVLVLGGSAGAVNVLSQLVAGLPPGLPAALFVVCHVRREFRSDLPEILSRNGPLLAHHASDGEPIRPGHIYVAPPDFHLEVLPGTVHLSHGPRENGHRPAIDPTFRTAARSYGRRVVAVVLSGSLSDGTAGLLAVRATGGVAIVQDPAEAAVAEMPQSARLIAGADHVLPLDAIAPTLVRLAREPASPTSTGGKTMPEPTSQPGDELVARDAAAQENGRRRNQLAFFTCPECGGATWQMDEEGLIRFRCHVGHAYYAEDMLAEQSQALEAALWTAVRTFREKAVLASQMATREQRLANAKAAERFLDEAQLAERYGNVIQDLLLKGLTPQG
jgi:two-component system chemotaxis response regulator CheB